MDREHLSNLLNNFFTKRGESDGGWAEVLPDDIDKLYEIIDTILRLKYETDSDGDLPIEYMLVNRNIEHFIWPCILPYETDYTSPFTDRMGRLERLMILSNVVGKLISTEFDIICYRQEDYKKEEVK